ncbi:cadherin repeat domain-containing protein [Rufibacter soli]
MRNFKNPLLFFSFLLSFTFWGCGEDDVDPMFQELRNQSYDLVVVSDASTSVPVSFTAAGTDLEKVIVEITKQGSTTVVGSNTLSNIKANSLNRVSLNVPFQSNDKAPSGIYTVNYKMISKAGEQNVGSYDINIINNMSPVFCTYTNALPSGKTVWIRLYVPNGATLPANDRTVYLTGSFGSREGGSDWDGGGGPHKFTQLSPTCYEIAMHLENGDKFKITRGNWDKQMTTATGAEYSDFTYNGESAFSATAFNWKDRPTVAPTSPAGEILNVPAEAVKSGMLTFVATLATGLDAKSGDYYVVEKGATNINSGVKMVAFEGANKVAAAVAKKPGVEYVVVKGNAAATGKNRYGFLQSAVWDGKTNPVQVTVGTFGQAGFALGNKIVIVGGATPGDWGASSGQNFTKTGEGKYSITIALKADSEYLLLPEYNQWDDKWAFGSGTPSAGTFDAQGSGPNFSTKGLAAGTYKIDVDFTTGTGTYKLTKV